jgi:hypothetical protein
MDEPSARVKVRSDRNIEGLRPRCIDTNTIVDHDDSNRDSNGHEPRRPNADNPGKTTGGQKSLAAVDR